MSRRICRSNYSHFLGVFLRALTATARLVLAVFPAFVQLFCQRCPACMAFSAGALAGQKACQFYISLLSSPGLAGLGRKRCRGCWGRRGIQCAYVFGICVGAGHAGDAAEKKYSHLHFLSPRGLWWLAVVSHVLFMDPTGSDVRPSPHYVLRVLLSDRLGKQKLTKSKPMAKQKQTKVKPKVNQKANQKQTKGKPKANQK